MTMRGVRGGVGVRSLLVDEAYYLYNAANDRDYGQESIEILLNVMENNKEDIIVVLAGYKDRMDAFYGFIPVRAPTRARVAVRAAGRAGVCASLHALPPVSGSAAPPVPCSLFRCWC